jgi:hypothetical protein
MLDARYSMLNAKARNARATVRQFSDVAKTVPIR